MYRIIVTILVLGLMLSVGSMVFAQSWSYHPSERWHDNFCYRQEICKVGDVNGDGRDDIIAFTRGEGNDAAGDVWVALSTGSSFGVGQRWHTNFCFGTEVCDVGDFNGDGRVDIVAFTRSYKTNDGEGDVWVALSTGSAFGSGQRWHDTFCYRQETCLVGDFNGDNKDDIVALSPPPTNANSPNEVWIALSVGNRFVAGDLWHDTLPCYGPSRCVVGDFDGDGLDDILSATDDNVRVIRSGGNGFTEAEAWTDVPHCTEEEQICAAADINLDRQADLVVFHRDVDFFNDEGIVELFPSYGVRYLREGVSATGFGEDSRGILGYRGFCVADEICAMGDINGDNYPDMIAFVRSTKSGDGEGDVWVSLNVGP